MNLDYLLSTIAVAAPAIGGALAVVWKKFADIHADAKERRRATCAENSAILGEIDRLHESMNKVMVGLHKLTQGVREIEAENATLHEEVVRAQTENMMLERRVAAIALEKHKMCDCARCR